MISSRDTSRARARRQQDQQRPLPGSAQAQLFLPTPCAHRPEHLYTELAKFGAHDSPLNRFSTAHADLNFTQK